VLEVIDKGSTTKSPPVPLLFVHGTWHGAWCWDDHFLDHFADRGFRALALSLRGHGCSETEKNLRACGLTDYIADVESVVTSLPAQPVMIGHSVGGFIVQKYLESHDAPAGVLIASTPPRGGRAGTVRAFKRHPWLMVKASITGDSLVPLRSPQLVREAFFSLDTPDADVVRCASLLGPESVRLGLDVLLQTIRPERISTPLLVLGAACDNTTMVAEVEATAGAYHTRAEIFPDMGHNMMLEPGWQAVAERIDGWLTTQRL
jgi:pimeloyl-ACP methyl ester carboxylesterase